ncbi:hypothetical protein [Poseidonibacter ostreae]|uniref:Type II toxin-antitoxin system RelE/ParE family toxin n=1 Tax=Poseidonibacter ostreae TaxID=2654171 RepID=A0A6L4WT01_9BACT|nr:hypothetical protein [Poseidonibacter ostreae]KAB7884999.1 hypothetical protein GA417_09740 [Poseidonibacter ostreae]KAB7888991.1 hypothetical protein GBG19_07320 [Poseidonibacter ostreae]KAB7891924.1 hypothetical protein GBG18_04870 [Poseidonibacter ostreae]
MSANKSKKLRSLVKAPSLKILPKEHFWISGLKREFELTAIVPLYVYVLDNIDELPRNKDLELSIGSSTIIYKIDDSENIYLITGWIGSRNSKKTKKSLPHQ